MFDLFVGVVVAWSVIDGDTIATTLRVWPNIVVSEERIRLVRIDTPELKSRIQCERALAQMAKSYTHWRLSQGKSIRVTTGYSKNRDSFGRVLGDVTVDGVSLSDELFRQRLARKYGTTGGWC